MANDVGGNPGMNVREKKQKGFPKENDHSIEFCQGQVRFEFKMLIH